MQQKYENEKNDVGATACVSTDDSSCKTTRMILWEKKKLVQYKELNRKYANN